jgi:hypothetical protein
MPTCHISEDTAYPSITFMNVMYGSTVIATQRGCAAQAARRCLSAQQRRPGDGPFACCVSARPYLRACAGRRPPASRSGTTGALKPITKMQRKRQHAS